MGWWNSWNLRNGGGFRVVAAWNGRAGEGEWAFGFIHMFMQLVRGKHRGQVCQILSYSIRFFRLFLGWRRGRRGGGRVDSGWIRGGDGRGGQKGGFTEGRGWRRARRPSGTAETAVLPGERERNLPPHFRKRGIARSERAGLDCPRERQTVRTFSESAAAVGRVPPERAARAPEQGCARGERDGLRRQRVACRSRQGAVRVGHDAAHFVQSRRRH